MQMIKPIYCLLCKYKSVLAYLFFGACTTLINVAVYTLCTRFLALAMMTSVCVAWFVAVLFAYVTNRLFVFKSFANSALLVAKEMFLFFACRLATGGFDAFFMHVFVTIFAWHDVLVKIISNILVIIFNYLASKFFIFKGEKK